MLDTKKIESSINISFLDALFVILFPTLGSLAALILLFLGFGGLIELIIFIVMYAATMIGVEVGFHRYFTHKSFKTSKSIEIILAVLGSMTGQGGVLWWASIHRNHHKYSDNHLDPHSLDDQSKHHLNNFLFAHFGWLFDKNKTKSNGGWLKNVKDWQSKKYLINIQMQYKIWFLIGLIIPAIFGYLYHQSLMGLILGFLWGGTFRLFVSLNSFWAINSVCHSFGQRPFNTKDQSRNNVLVAILTFGQGWHNNHHAFPNSANLQFKWWQIDIAGLFIKLLCLTGFAWNQISYKKEVIERRAS